MTITVENFEVELFHVGGASFTIVYILISFPHV